MRAFVTWAGLALALTGCQPQAPDGSAAQAPADAPPPAAAAPQAFDGDLNALGTEPFWAVQIRATQITIQRPDQPNLVANNPGKAVSGSTAVWNTQAGTLALKVTLTEAACSDGMSDLTYPYQALIALGAETLKGCAAKADAMPKESQ